jgi:hypothetical protein
MAVERVSDAGAVWVDIFHPGGPGRSAWRQRETAFAAWRRAFKILDAAAAPESVVFVTNHPTGAADALEQSAQRRKGPPVVWLSQQRRGNLGPHTLRLCTWADVERGALVGQTFTVGIFDGGTDEQRLEATMRVRPVKSPEPAKRFDPSRPLPAVGIKPQPERGSCPIHGAFVEFRGGRCAGCAELSEAWARYEPGPVSLAARSPRWSDVFDTPLALAPPGAVEEDEDADPDAAFVRASRAARGAGLPTVRTDPSLKGDEWRMGFAPIPEGRLREALIAPVTTEMLERAWRESQRRFWGPPVHEDVLEAAKRLHDRGESGPSACAAPDIIPAAVALRRGRPVPRVVVDNGWDDA